MVNIDVAGRAEALTAIPRVVDKTVGAQLRARELSASSLRGSTAEYDRVCDQYSCNAMPPALACMAGLGTPPYFLYKMVGFDT